MEIKTQKTRVARKSRRAEESWISPTFPRSPAHPDTIRTPNTAIKLDSEFVSFWSIFSIVNTLRT
jgi:hypothetical protein